VRRASESDSLQFIRTSELCELLRISKPTLWRLRRRRDFPQPTGMTDRVVAWRRADIEHWLRTRLTGASNGGAPRTTAATRSNGGGSVQTDSAAQQTASALRTRKRIKAPRSTVSPLVSREISQLELPLQMFD